MKEHYTEELTHLKEMVLRMGGLAEPMTHRVVQALVERKREILSEVKQREQKVNQLHMDIDETALGMIALRQPTAKDARSMELILVSRHLERIADHATNICEDVIFLVKGKDIRHQGPLA